MNWCQFTIQFSFRFLNWIANFNSNEFNSATLMYTYMFVRRFIEKHKSPVWNTDFVWRYGVLTLLYFYFHFFSFRILVMPPWVISNHAAPLCLSSSQTTGRICIGPSDSSCPRTGWNRLVTLRWVSVENEKTRKADGNAVWFTNYEPRYVTYMLDA